MHETKFVPGEHTQSLIERDMQDSYLRYSMSVIVARALPDVRDGLKPVHRRVLFGMHDLGVYPGKPYKKSARIVGDVIGKYHPHGDTAVYETLVRMAQDFSLRYPLVDGQGNFGSVDGDSAAAMRYTEARMTRMGELMLEDLEKGTVDYNANYDDSLEEPSVLPSAIPNLLVNGSTGIAVGMATNMPPHNLREIANAIRAVIANPEIPVEELLQYVSGPDFPTGATICGRSGIRDAYLTGRGRVVVRAKMEAELDARGRTRLIVTEIPYMVNKSTMLEKIADMVRDKKLEGISDLRDESDRHGMRVVIELKKDAVAEVVKNNLYKYSQLQDTFGINNMVIVKKRPVMVNLKDLIEYYIEHRHEIVVRRTQHDLKKSLDRAHILEGLRIAQHNIEEVIRIIRGSSSPDLAKESLRSAFGLSEIQAQAIVDMRLRSITGLEIDKIENEYRELMLTIADFEDILANKARRMAIVQARLDEIVVKYGDERRTSIEDSLDDFEIEDLIPDEEQVITLSKEGYIRRVSIDTFKAQGRGGKGVQGAGLKNDDLIETIITASTHSALLIFTNRGRMHWTKVYKLPEGSRTGKGRPIINFLELVENEKVSAIVPVRKYAEGFCLMMVTRHGTINKMDLALFSHPRRAGINAIVLNEGDELVSVLLAKSDGATNVMIATRKGQAIAFPPASFRSMGRGTRGVRGIRLEDGDTVIGMIMPEPTQMVLTLTQKGYAKRTAPDEYRVTNRGGKGVRNVQITEKTGEAVNVAAVLEDYDVIITSQQGQVIRIGCDTIRITGRDAQGVMAIRLYEGDAVMDMVALPSVEDIEKASEESQQAFAAAKEVDLSEEDLAEGESNETVEPEDDSDKTEG